MTSERSESSSYLETDSAEKSKNTNSSEERRKITKAPQIFLNNTIQESQNFISTLKEPN